VKIAVVGSGISGLVAARSLGAQHEVELFERESYIGGHTNTIAVEEGGRSLAVDTGFIVFNHRNYPNFTRLLNQLGVASRETSMSFSVSDERSGLEYSGASIGALFAQRRNLVRPSFYRMLRDILRFNRRAPVEARGGAAALSLGEYLERRRYSAEFVAHYLTPLVASIWSSPSERVHEFPFRSLVSFLENHGMLQVWGRPRWRTIVGGSQRYVEVLTAPFRDRIHLDSPVRSITRGDAAVELEIEGGGRRTFDHVVLACHSDQALALLTDATPAEREMLGAIPYQANEAVLHTDTSLLPRRRRAWASWNYRICEEGAAGVAVTYNMNMLQGLQSERTYCVTLNQSERIDPERIIRRIPYHHPLYTLEAPRAQALRREQLASGRTSFCGAWCGNGFHEDGVNSALDVCRALGVDPEP
jgi:predicted NAD/FAD-binding protein